MGYRLLLDENIEHEALHRLTDDGHDVEHIESVPCLGKGTGDDEIARYSLATDRTIVTYDDDFIEDVSQSRYRAVFFFADDSISAKEIAAIIDSMSKVYPDEDVTGLQKTGREWL
jgi:predicted nuclease of predicted toxin-antitoxin system